jgi:hypothetical protein
MVRKTARRPQPERGLYSYRIPDPGARGTVSAAWTARGPTDLPGRAWRRTGVVRLDGYGRVCGVSTRDLKFEPGEDEQGR